MFGIRLCSLLTLLSFILSACSSPQEGEVDVGCQLSSDCPLQYKCEDERCVPTQPTVCEGEDCLCHNDLECDLGQRCDLLTGTCQQIECLIPSDCLSGELCLNGSCLTDLEVDRDFDGVPDVLDRCPEVSDPRQLDTDLDSLGDECDADIDNDGLANDDDNCPLIGNPEQGDINRDGKGNACDPELSMISLQGQIDFSAIPQANNQEAQLWIQGRDTPLGIDAQGRFFAEAVSQEPRTLKVILRWPIFGSREFDVTLPDFTAIHDMGILRLELPQVALSNVSLRASVRLEDETNRSGIKVSALVGEQELSAVYTDREGRFELPVPLAHFTLAFAYPSYEPHKLELIYSPLRDGTPEFISEDGPWDDSHVITLSSIRQAVELEVAYSPVWLPSDQLTFELSLTNQRLERSLVTSSRSITLDELPEGLYQLRVSAPGFEEVSQDVLLEGGENVRVTLALSLNSFSESGLSLRGLSLSREELEELGDLRGADLSGIHLRGAELCGLDLSGASLVLSDLSEADLSGVDLSQARLDNADLTGANLIGTNLSQASLFGAKLDEALLYSGEPSCLMERRETDLSAANFTQASFKRAIFSLDATSEDEFTPCEGDHLSSPRFDGVIWDQADLEEAQLFGAQLKDSEFNSVNLTRAKLEGACLSNSFINESSADEVNLRGAILSGSSLRRVNMRAGDFRGATLRHTYLIDVDLSEALLNEIKAEEGLFIRDCTLNETSFMGAWLTGSSWVGSFFNHVYLRDAILHNSDLSLVRALNVDMTNLDLSGSNLSSASIVNTLLRGANLSNAELRQTDFNRSDLRGAELSNAYIERSTFELALYDFETIWPEDFAYRAQGALGPYSQLQGIRLPPHFDLSGLQLSGADFTRATLREVNFSDTILSEALFDHAQLSDAVFEGAILDNTQWVEAEIDRVNFRRADLSEALMIGVARDALLYPLNADGEDPLISPIFADFSDSRLMNTRLMRFNLEGSLFQDSTLTGAVFQELLGCDGITEEIAQTSLLCVEYPNLNNLTALNPDPEAPRLWSFISPVLGAPDLITGNLAELDLEGIDLSDSSLHYAQSRSLVSCPSASPQGARCIESTNGDFTLFGPRVIVQGESFVGADLSSLDLSASVITDCDFLDSLFEGASLAESDLTGTEFHAMNLRVHYDHLTQCPIDTQYSLASCGGLFAPPCAYTEVECPELEWVSLPGGTLPLAEIESGELPVPSFQIMRTEITNAQYRRCVDAGVCNRLNTHPNISPTCSWTDEPGEQENFPATCMSWHELNIFAAWVGARLLSEVEWEYAATSGGQGTSYPWGEDDFSNSPGLQCQIYNHYLCDHDPLAEIPFPLKAVCTTPLGNTEQGLCDMAGNASEWVADRSSYRSLEQWSPTDHRGDCPEKCPLNAADPSYGPDDYVSVPHIYRGFSKTPPANSIRGDLYGQSFDPFTIHDRRFNSFSSPMSEGGRLAR